MIQTPSRWVSTLDSKSSQANQFRDRSFEQNLGNEEFMKGNFTEAIDFYSRAIEINDQNPIYFSNSK